MNLRLIGVSCLAGLAGIGVAVAVSACQSSQAKNKELAKQGATDPQEGEGPPDQPDQQHGQGGRHGGAHRRQRLRRRRDAQERLGPQALCNVPIAIDVKDAKGKSVFKNDDPGPRPRR